MPFGRGWAPSRCRLLGPLLEELTSEATAELGTEGPVQVQRFAQLRYLGQEHTLEVPIDDGDVDDATISRARDAFDRLSEEAYAFSLDQPLQLVAARVAVSSPTSSFAWQRR